MNRYTFMEMDGALAERLNEILLEMPKKTPYKERKAEADEALEKFWPCWKETKLCRSSWTMC